VTTSPGRDRSIWGLPGDDAATDSAAAALGPDKTRIPPVHTRPFGCEELHAVHFQHVADRGGFSDAIVIPIPESGRQIVRRALAIATHHRGRVSFLCDTHDQAVRMFRLAARLLPEHRFVSMDRAAAGAWGLLA
jgi:hypothetical protein